MIFMLGGFFIITEKQQIMEGVSKEEFEKLAKMIHSDSSPVGIDAKKTHILILHKLDEILTRIEKLEKAQESK